MIPPPRTCVTCLHYDAEVQARIKHLGQTEVFGGVCRAPQAIDLETGVPLLQAALDQRVTLYGDSTGRCGYLAVWWEARR